VVVVDVANVMGARADGWWRDRAGAALRLGREVDALARRGGEATSEVGMWILVLEGQARPAAALLRADEGEARTGRRWCAWCQRRGRATTRSSALSPRSSPGTKRAWS
jgi:hypothetical protein